MRAASCAIWRRAESVHLRLTSCNLRRMTKRKDGGWVSIPEAVKRLRISRAAIYKAIRERRLKAEVREVVRRALRIEAASLKAFSRAHQARANQRRGGRRKPTPKRLG